MSTGNGGNAAAVQAQLDDVRSNVCFLVICMVLLLAFMIFEFSHWFRATDALADRIARIKDEADLRSSHQADLRRRRAA